MDFRLSIENWFRNIMFPVYERTTDGNDWYYVESENVQDNTKINLEYALIHPILTPALLFISNLFAQSKFIVKDANTDEVIKNHALNKLLNNPNFFQTRIDFLEQLQFLKLSQGVGVIYVKRGIGMTDLKDIDSLYVLRSDLLTFPDDFGTNFIFRRRSEKFLNTIVEYDKDGNRPMKIPLKDLIFLWDLPPVHDKNNGFVNKSRIDGLHQTLNNTVDSLIAKNIILKSNGKEMLSSASTNGGGFPFGEDEQNDAKRMWNNGYGLGFGRSRLFMSKAPVNWKSLHIALRDLGLDESTKVDGNIVYTALHIPPDVLSIDRKKTTYANFKESMTSYIQNDIQSMMNDLVESLSNFINDDSIIIEGSYEHMPVMQFLNKQKYESINVQVTALANARRAGIPDDMALDLVGLPKNTTLGELMEVQMQENAQEQSQEQEDTGASNESAPEENR